MRRNKAPQHRRGSATPRNAHIERQTRETKISLELSLDGGEVAPSTGVGFFDHMLELLGRHAGLGLVVEAKGDLETGAHHTVEDVGIAFGQALDQALGDRGGIRRYGHAVVPMDEALGECAIDVSGRPFCRFESELPAVSIAGFDSELAEEFFRAVSSNAKLTVHVSSPLREQRTPPDRGDVQGLRPRPAGGGRDRPARGRSAVDEGDADVTRVAILDYGMGNLRSVEKALERVGAEAVITDDHELARSADGLVLPGVGAFAAAMERIGQRGLDGLIRERVEAGVPVLGICLGFQLLFESSSELGGAAGLGLVDGPVTGLEAEGMKVPHIGWEPVAWESESELIEGIDDGTPFYFVHSFAPRPKRAARPARHRGARRALRLRDRPPAGLRGPVPPGEVELRRPSPAGQLLDHLLRRPRNQPPQRRRGSASASGLRLAVILYPAIDIRGGRAVRLVQGDYDRETAFDADPLDAASRWLEQGARALHVVDLDGARAGAPVNIEHVERICEAASVPVQVGGGLREAGDVAAVIAAGAARAILGTAALSDPALVEALAAEHGERIVVAADARSGAVAVEGWERRHRRRGRGRDRRPRPARGQPFRLHPGRGRRDARGSRPARARSCGRGRVCGRGGADLLGRDRHPRAPERARAPRRRRRLAA